MSSTVCAAVGPGPSDSSHDLAIGAGRAIGGGPDEAPGSAPAERPVGHQKVPAITGWSLNGLGVTSERGALPGVLL